MNTRLADLTVRHIITLLVLAALIAGLIVIGVRAHDRSIAANRAERCAENAPLNPLAQQLCQQS